jgi:nitrogen fixation protein FixH
MSTQSYDPSRGRWVPWAFTGGMLLVVAVNGVLIWAALSTFTGVNTPRAYDRGRTYNDVLHEAARQDALGWHPRVRLEAGTLRIEVRDAAGNPVPGDLLGHLLRPLTGERLPLLISSTAPGVWRADAAAAQAGQWDTQLVLHGPGGVLDIRERVIVP